MERKCIFFFLYLSLRPFFFLYLSHRNVFTFASFVIAVSIGLHCFVCVIRLKSYIRFCYAKLFHLLAALRPTIIYTSMSLISLRERCGLGKEGVESGREESYTRSVIYADILCVALVRVFVRWHLVTLYDIMSIGVLVHSSSILHHVIRSIVSSC